MNEVLQLSTITVLGLALLVLPVVTAGPAVHRLVKRDTECTGQGGVCQYDTIDCDGTYQSGKCSGPTSRRCCLPYDDTDCDNKYGVCQDEGAPCTAGYQSYLCDGPSYRLCCLPDDSLCTAEDGVCQDYTSNPCDGEYLIGKCGGPSARRCCVPPAGSGDCSSFTIVSREEWGAREPNDFTSISVPVHEFFVHHTTGSTCNDANSCITRLKSIQNYHMDTKGWDDIGYSFLVGGDGEVYEGRGWGNQGAHTSGHNDKAFAASFIGEFTNSLPTPQAITATKCLLEYGVQQGYIAADYTLYGHRDVSATACPGDTLYQEIQTWTNY